MIRRETRMLLRHYLEQRWQEERHGSYYQPIVQWCSRRTPGGGTFILWCHRVTRVLLTVLRSRR